MVAILLATTVAGVVARSPDCVFATPLGRICHPRLDSAFAFYRAAPWKTAVPIDQIMDFKQLSVSIRPWSV